MKLLLALIFLSLPVLAWGHAGPLDAYGCHSNKQLLGSSSKRECHTGYLAGQVFWSTTAEYQAYIAASEAEVTRLKADLALSRADLALCKTNCPVLPKTMGLKWTANSEADLAGYRVYCGTQSKVYGIIFTVDKTLQTATVPNLTSGTYYCSITAYDQTGNESGHSTEVSKVIP